MALQKHRRRLLTTHVVGTATVLHGKVRVTGGSVTGTDTSDIDVDVSVTV